MNILPLKSGFRCNVKAKEESSESMPAIFLADILLKCRNLLCNKQILLLSCVSYIIYQIIKYSLKIS